MQNKGGGHGEIGFHLAKNLADKDLTVTIVQDSAAKKEALPFSKYGELPSSVNVEWVDTSDASAVEAACGDKATHVFDNNSKKPGDAAPIISAAKKSDAFYSFVSSAGMYAAKGMLKEEKKVKGSMGQGGEEGQGPADGPERRCGRAGCIASRRRRIDGGRSMASAERPP